MKINQRMRGSKRLFDGCRHICSSDGGRNCLIMCAAGGDIGCASVQLEGATGITRDGCYLAGRKFDGSVRGNISCASLAWANDRLKLILGVRLVQAYCRQSAIQVAYAARSGGHRWPVSSSRICVYVCWGVWSRIPFFSTKLKRDESLARAHCRVCRNGSLIYWYYIYNYFNIDIIID